MIQAKHCVSRNYCLFYDHSAYVFLPASKVIAQSRNLLPGELTYTLFLVYH